MTEETAAKTTISLTDDEREAFTRLKTHITALKESVIQYDLALMRLKTSRDQGLQQIAQALAAADKTVEDVVRSRGHNPAERLWLFDPETFDITG
jgi:Holliday junction resolvasome RuvABC ATP-dependent DNA helicase subunit